MHQQEIQTRTKFGEKLRALIKSNAVQPKDPLSFCHIEGSYPENRLVQIPLQAVLTSPEITLGFVDLMLGPALPSSLTFYLMNTGDALQELMESEYFFFTVKYAVTSKDTRITSISKMHDSKGNVNDALEDMWLRIVQKTAARSTNENLN